MVGAGDSCGVRARVALIGLIAAGLAGCATAGSAPHNSHSAMEDAVAQPFKDLGLVRENASEVLLQTVAAPYQVDEGADCAALRTSIAQLDEILGADVDAGEAANEGVGIEIVSGALRSALGLPFRGIIRRMSGAEARDRLRARAILAGMVRRGFLKGLARSAGCP